MAHHLGRARLTAASPPLGPGKTPLGDEALPVGCNTETIVWTVLGHRLRRLCSVPQEITCINSLLAFFKRETVYRFSSHIRRTHITVMRRWHSCSSLIPHRHLQTHSQLRYLGHTSFFGIAKRGTLSRYQSEGRSISGLKLRKKHCIKSFSNPALNYSSNCPSLLILCAS